MALTMRDMVRLLAIAVGLGALAVVASYCAGCSAGPQLPVTTTPITITCSWSIGDGGAAEDNDCLVDRSSAVSDAETTGNRARDVRVDPHTTVSAVP